MRTRYQLTLLTLVLVASVVAAVVLYGRDRHAFLFYGDAASHIVKGRELVDSRYPGISSIGSVWLPLPHILLVPFVVFDVLFFSGIAGAALGIPCLLATAALLFSIVRRLTGSAPVSFISACLFALNPNVVYISLTPMSEPCLYFFIALGGYALLRWSVQEEARWLVLCSASVMLATMCRYEAWPLALFVSVLAAVKGMVSWKESRNAEATKMVGIALLAIAGIILWLWWNAYKFGDALQFAPWKYRAPPSDIRNPMSYRQEAVSFTLLRAVLNIFGPVALLVCGAGMVWLKRFLIHRRDILLTIYLSIPSLFIFVGILRDYVLIDQWWWNWRFVLIFGLFVSVVGGIGLSELFRRFQSKLVRGTVLVGLLAMPVTQLTVSSVSVAAYEDASKIFGGLSKYAAALGERLPQLTKKGSIELFTGSGLGERIMVSSGIPLRNFRLVVSPGGLDLQGPLRNGDRYVVIGKVRLPDSRQTVDYWLSRREEFLRLYTILFEDEHYILLEKKT